MRTHFIVALGILGLAAVFGCSSTPVRYHTAYKLMGCDVPVSRDKVIESLMAQGYQRSSEPMPPYDILHKPEIVKKGSLAAEPYEDRAGDIGLVVCGSGTESYILTEEIRGCGKRKDCTVENQKEIRRLVEGWGCDVEERSGRSKAWGLEDRQDWTRESCEFIATNLMF